MLCALVLASLASVAPMPPAPMSTIVAEREAAEADHLRRLGLWGASSVVGGAGLFALSQPALLGDGAPRQLEGFAIQSMAWGGINLAIVAIGSLAPKTTPTMSTMSTMSKMRADALDAEDDLAKVLWVNVGLDVGYMMAGGTMMAASQLGAEPSVDWLSHGAGIVTQGAGLFILDLIAVWGSDARERALADLPAEGSEP